MKKIEFKPPLILVDGSSYLHRAFHALPPLINSKGEPTGAIFGVVNMLRRLIKDYKPSHIAVIFDAKGKTFRHKLYPKYKANRPPMADELKSQVRPLHDLIKALGLPLISIEGVEADDVIGTLATHATQAGMKTLISTGDKDFAQLVNQNISLINTMTNTVLDSKGIENKYGVPPHLMRDFLALTGDSSDNIPGVPKVGPKTAAKWLQEYGSLENLIKHAGEIKGKIGENLRNSLELLSLSKKLVTIKCDVFLDVHPKELIDEKDNLDKLLPLVKNLEFKSWLSELLEKTHASEKNAFELILKKEDFNRWLTKLKQSKFFAVDTETTSLDYMKAKIVGISFATENYDACYIPFAHNYENAPQQLNREFVLTELKPLLEDVNIKKVGQHLKYDKEVLANHDINLQGIEFDTMLESYVFNSTASRHDLDSLALKYLSYRTIHFEDVAGSGAKQITFDQVPLEEAAPYASEDASVTMQLHHYFWPKIEANKNLKDVLLTIEMPLLTVLARIERTGVLINANFLHKQSDSLAKRLQELEEDTYSIADGVFNLNSPKQLQEILFEKLKLPILKKTPKGQPSTAEDVLQELAYDFPLPKLILEYRTLSKLKSTYTDRLPEQINTQTGRVHTSYHQAVTATGRLSSANPNLQNIPIRSEEGRKIRQAFIAPQNYKLLAADYSQIELRIMAHLSQDKGLLDAFSKGLDIHKTTAAEIFGIHHDKVTKLQRRKAKAINFGLIYGMSSFGLAKQIGVERNVAQVYIDSYFTKYPAVQTYMENTRRQAHEQGYVKTLFGRRLYIPEINAKNIQRQKAAERAAINGPTQGTAADIIKIAMIQIDNWLQKNNIDARMIMQVHDELVFEVHEKIIDSVKQKIIELMTQTTQLTVPLVVDIGVGDNWDEAH